MARHTRGDVVIEYRFWPGWVLTPGVLDRAETPFWRALSLWGNRLTPWLWQMHIVRDGTGV